MIGEERNQAGAQARALELARVERRGRKPLRNEAELRHQLLSEGLEPYRWSNGPGASYAEHRHSYVKVLYVVKGSISFTLTDQQRTITLEAGDRLDLPARTPHTALVGADGVVCLEAPRT